MKKRLHSKNREEKSDFSWGKTEQKMWARSNNNGKWWVLISFPPASQSWEVCVSQRRKNDGAKGSGKDRGASFSPPFWTHEEEKLETETEALETLRKLNTGFNGQSDSVAPCFCKMTRELDPLPLSWGCYCSCSYFCLTRPRQRIARALSLTHTHR